MAWPSQKSNSDDELEAMLEDDAGYRSNPAEVYGRRWLLGWFRTLFGTLAALFFLFFASKFLYGKHTDNLSRARAVFSRDFAGLNPAYHLDPEEILPLPGKSKKPSHDFRGIKSAKLSTMPGKTYQGLTCLSHYPGETCPLPGQCAPAAPDASEEVKSKGACVHWQKGYLAHPAPITPADVLRGQENARKSFTSKWDGNGTWDGQEWTPTASTRSSRYRFFTPQDMHQCLAGKRMYIQGDSMMRQVYNRLIHWSREIPSYAEHYYGGLSLYTVYLNGTDEWLIWRDGDRSLYSRDKDEAAGVAFRVFYDWQQDNLNDIDANFRAITDLDVDVAVLGFNYWYPLSFDHSRVPGCLDAFYSKTGWDGILAWYAAPQQYTGKDAWWYVGEAERMRYYAQDRREREGKRIVVLPSDTIVRQIDAMGTPRRNCRVESPSDPPECLYDAHFGCGILAAFPNPVGGGPNGMKAPLGYDCRDTYNFAVLQNLLNTVC